MTMRIAPARLALLLAAVPLLTLALAVVVLWPQGPAPPDIQGAVLAEPRALPEVELTDHRGRSFATSDLTGDWHLVSYGFTHCPDICPTTLYEVAEFRRRLAGQADFNDLDVLFYTIDPRRDTVERLADYVPWFHEGFVGLRPSSAAAADTFEDSLGITARVQPAEEPSDYRVDHGLMLFLIDPQGRFRATLAPTRERDGRQHYQPEQLLADYRAVRTWVDRTS